MLAVLGASAGLVSCGGDDEPVASDPGRTVTETVTAPSPTPTPPPGDPAAPGSADAQDDPAGGGQPGTTDGEPAPGAPADGSCGNVTITPNSGDGAFDVQVMGIGCEEAEALIKSPDGLTSWDCQPVGGDGEAGGSQTIRCRDGGRTIVFETGV